MILTNHKLSTRNNFTGKAINNLDNTSIKQLIDGNPCYMEYENKYLQRRFHQNSYLSQLKEQHKQEVIKEDTINQHTASPASLEKLLNEHEKRDIMVQQRFDKFAKIHNGEKPLLILDIDNTMLYARFFSEEMKIDDIVTYFGEEFVARNNAKVLKLQKTLYLEIINGQLIDTLGTEHTEISLWIQDNDTLHKYKKGGIYDYNHNNNMIQCKISRTEVIGCIIEVRSHEILDDDETEDEEEEYDDNPTMDGNIRSYTESHEIEISFVEENEHLSKLEPCLNRVGYLPVDFIYEGFLIRLRPNLDEFLEYASEDFDIVIYTSAVKGVYEGLLKVLHQYIKDQLGKDDEEELTLWTDSLFRSDCTLKTEHRVKPYHHKDLTLFGCDLSRVVMIDNSPIVVSGQEPNIILIRDFFGKDQLDDEFMEVYTLLDTIKDIKGDIRYFVCDIDDISDAEEVKLDLLTEESCKQITIEFMNILKKEFKQNNGRRASISISQSTKRYSLSQSNVGNATALISQTSDKIHPPHHAHHAYAATTSSPLLFHGRSQPIWQTKMEHRKKELKSKWKGRHKSLLSVPADFGKLAVRRHSRYSSMSPKLQDSTNFDIQASIDEGTGDLLIMDVLTESQEEAIDIDSTFGFAGNYYEENDGDITDYEQDEDEYMLINPAPTTKPKKKRAVVKFRGMTSADIRAVHDIDKYGNEKYSVSPSDSDTKPLRIEFAMIDDDEDEKILIKQENEINSLKKWNHSMDEEKINISNQVNNININNTDLTTEPLLLSDDNDKDKNKKDKKNINKQKKKKKSRLESEFNENNGNGFCRLFCGL